MELIEISELTEVEKLLEMQQKPKILNWQPTISFEALIEEMCINDEKLAKLENLIKQSRLTCSNFGNELINC